MRILAVLFISLFLVVCSDVRDKIDQTSEASILETPVLGLSCTEPACNDSLGDIYVATIFSNAEAQVVLYSMVGMTCGATECVMDLMNAVFYSQVDGQFSETTTLREGEYTVTAFLAKQANSPAAVPPNFTFIAHLAEEAEFFCLAAGTMGTDGVINLTAKTSKIELSECFPGSPILH